MRAWRLMGLPCILLAGTAWAQNLGQPNSATPVAYEYAEEDPIGAPHLAPEETIDESPGEPWKIPQPYALSSRGIEIGGWFQGGIFANAWGAPSNGPLGFNNVGSGFTVNQLWGYITKEADTGGYGVDWGGRIDYIFGADGPDTQCFGDQSWDWGWNSAPEYGSAIPQAYVELAFNRLKIRGGHFYTIIGWEVVQAPDNFFYTHAYTMYYGEPFTHTGLLAEYDLNEKVKLFGGWTDGWDNGWENKADASTFLGGVFLTLTDRLTFNWACTAGDLGHDAAGVAQGDVYMNSIVGELKLTEQTKYIFQHDLGAISGLGVPPGQWYAINQYLEHEFNEHWATCLRFEWFLDDDGTRTPNHHGDLGNSGDYYEVTLGLNFKPNANIRIRPELRYDWYRGDLATGVHPFDHGTRSEQLSGGFDVVVTF